MPFSLSVIFLHVLSCIPFDQFAEDINTDLIEARQCLSREDNSHNYRLPQII